MAGRPPTPTRLKILKGETRPSRVNQREPQPAGVGAKSPAWLKGKARRHWTRIQPLVAGMQVHTDADPDALALLCDALAQYVQASDVLRTRGNAVEIVNDRGEVTEYAVRVEVRIAADAWRRVNLMMQQFGLTPSSRAKVAAREAEVVDPFEELLGRRSS